MTLNHLLIDVVLPQRTYLCNALLTVGDVSHRIVQFSQSSADCLGVRCVGHVAWSVMMMMMMMMMCFAMCNVFFS